MRETRLINKDIFDDPTDRCPAGSIQEYDLISEWSRSELVETIQELDERLFQLEEIIADAHSDDYSDFMSLTLFLKRGSKKHKIWQELHLKKYPENY